MRGGRKAAPLFIWYNVSMDKNNVAADVDAYIAAAAPEARPVMAELRAVIRETLPDADERISWGVPFYRQGGGMVGGFAAYRGHVSFGFTDEAALAPELHETLHRQGYATAKKTLQVRFDQPVPAEVITRILLAQVALNEAKQAKKK